MVKVKIYIHKSIEQNASSYYDQAKKYRKKIDGATTAVNKAKIKLEELQTKEISFQKQLEKKKEKLLDTRKKEWFEKFHWFYSSDGFLCIGGRDATTNEIVIKKHTDNHDIVFHTDMAGSPFFVIKTERKEITENTLNETAQATASYSKAWKLGLATSDVFYVLPEQVSKEANPGEYMTKGSFMIRGKTTYLHPEIKLAIGIKDNQIIGGPVESVKAHAEKFVVIKQGREKASDIAKKIKKKFTFGELDDIIRFLPSGGCNII